MSNVQTKRLYDIAVVFIIICELLIGVLRKQLAGVYKSLYIRKTILKVAVGHIAAVGIFFLHCGNDPVVVLFAVHCYHIVSDIVYRMYRAAACIKHDVISAEFILVYHCFLPCMLKMPPLSVGRHFAV